MTIKEVADRTGIAAATIRAWEQRHGHPRPARTPSGYREYSDADVALLRRVAGYRTRGFSVQAAFERALDDPSGATDRPSLYGALVAAGGGIGPRTLSKRTLISISRAIEDEAIARAAGPVVVAAFQQEKNFRAAEHRYRRLAGVSDATIIFADFETVRTDGDGMSLVPTPPEATLGHEWAVVIDAPGYAACLIGWESPESERDTDRPDMERTFEALWTMDPQAVRATAMVAPSLVRGADPALADHLTRLLTDRPLAFEAPVPGLTALTNRIVGYLE
jgi:MerR family transcriptional regulator, light-induced transcriptional regulator